MAAFRHYSFVPSLWIALFLSQSPLYSAESIVNAASRQPVLAPNTWATIYGQNLANSTAAASGPPVAQLAGVSVRVNSAPAEISFVSPTQVNFRVPTDVEPGPVLLFLRRDVFIGASLSLILQSTAPALFTAADGKTALVTRPNGTLVEEAKPARPGEILTLWATGLGPTVRQAQPDGTRLEILADRESFQVSLGDQTLRVLYVGLAPGIPGVYQVNVELPDPLPADRQLRLRASRNESPPEVFLATEPQ